VTSGAAGDQGVPGVSEDVAPVPDGLFDLELDGTAATASFTFEEPGMYAYFCAVHSGMFGSVQVD
jgi:plastocyanin